ncbi:iron complex transport system permease protein [Pseudonocardia thermophila]|jgi:ABC-type Fe3+-siderophore transport system, permease component|uniref:Iron complex transport system permease protein n=1 Tax=Pseudonocardia thermophila TaxID=1848 RepID=A0A1M6QKJ6_PSETH|nr:iron ABC transporter permease [Pseudonocardia thermophila]SHK20688.1 iron complex transport system permease protein [Pseudonocardia thermophila]
MTRTAPVPARTADAGGAPTRPLRVAGVATVGAVLALLLAAVHLTQGTADVGVGDLLRFVVGAGTEQADAVVIASRIPRLLAGVLVGVALGLAGCVLQTISRNSLASPDTLGVGRGAYVLIVALSVAGLALPVPFAGAVAFVGGLAAAALVLVLSSGVGSGPTRLVLAGSAVGLALESVTVALLLLFEEQTVGLYAWGSGTLSQFGMTSMAWMAPVVAVAFLLLLTLSTELDLHGLGDDSASVLGVNVRRTRLFGVLLAVLLSAAAVTVAGPVGFVGLAAPAIVRLLVPLVPGLARHRALLPMSALAGIIVVIGADVLARLALGAQVGGVEVPTGVVTSFLGALVLVGLACRYRQSGPTRAAPAARSARLRGRAGFVVVLVVVAVGTVGAATAATLLGDAKLLTGDVVNYLTGRSGPLVTFVLDARVPRVLAALTAGAALAIAGAVIQAACRNPLAEPGIIGVTGGAGLGAVLAITLVPVAGTALITGSALVGAAVATLAVFGLAARGGLDSDRLVLIGVGVSAAAAAAITFVILLSDPFNVGKALTWLSGSTYGRTLPQVVPVVLALLVAVPILWRSRRELDLVAVDDDTPRVAGIALERSRPLLLGLACLLTAMAVSAVGVISFVGLVAPHAARALVGAKHERVLPVTALLGALLVSVADTVGRTVIAPGQLPAGLVAALVGTPYFVWLLWRSRTA